MDVPDEEFDWEVFKLILLQMFAHYMELTMARPMKCMILLLIMEWVSVLFDIPPYWVRFL